MIETNARLVWNGSAVKESLKARLLGNLKKSTHLYKETLIALLSVQGSPGNYSSPGEPPFKQSNNLINSINEDYVVEYAGAEGIQLIGQISTDVAYAATLEFGGALQVDPSEKTYATRSIQKWGTVTVIAPRPAWAPAFGIVKDIMAQQLAE